MGRASQTRLVKALLAAHGQTYAEEAGIDVARNSPTHLFRLLCLSLLLSARIRASVAVSAARALSRQRWNSAKAMVEAPWSERARVLNEAGYARYDERTATMLGDSSQLLLDRWKGDLRRLRDEAERDPATERRLLKQFKGIGEVGVDIYFREAQHAWGELRPFFDRRALRAAAELGLSDSPKQLARLVPADQLPVLATALVRLERAGNYDALRKG